MAAGARLTKRGASVMRRIDPQDESNDDRQIVLDGPPPTEIAEWLASAGAPDTAEDRRWLTSEYRTGGPGRARAVLGGVVMLAVVAATVVVATMLISGIDGVDHGVDVPMSLTVALSLSPGGLEHALTVTGSTAACGPETIEATEAVAGPRPLRPATGAAAIAAFEAAYYHARDGVLAREVVAAAAAISDAATIQAGIDSAPLGTTYCARIRRLNPGLYAVEITDTPPGAAPRVWRQRISTTQLDRHSVITAIVSE